MSSLDAELWLYFENQINVDEFPVDLHLTSVNSDLDFEQSNKCVYRTYLNSGYPHVMPWSATENINPARDHLVAVSIRLRHKTKDFFRQSIKWTLTFDVIIDEKVQSQAVTFCTDQSFEEGLSALSITHRGVHPFPKFCRHLIIWDVLAAPGPGLQEAKLKSWLSYPRATTPLLFGHRGMGAFIYEEHPSKHPGDNTIAGFNEAFSIGADGVELDVQLSYDDALIIRHDFSFGDEKSVNYYRDVDAAKIVEVDPDTPLLSGVFREVDTGLIIDVEVKYPMRVMNGLLENDDEELLRMDVDGQKVLRWPKNKLADLVLKAVEPEAHKRRLLLSTFHPDLALILSRKICPSLRPLVPVLALTRGEMHRDAPPEKFHLDLRNRTVASAACWARAVGLDGVAPFAASAFAVKAPLELLGDDLVTILWGRGLNSVEVLRDMQQQPWVFGLIFDKMNELLCQVKVSS